MRGLFKKAFFSKGEFQETANESKDQPLKKIKPSTCLDLAIGDRGYFCDGRSCVRMQSFERKILARWFGDVTVRERERERNQVQILADCYATTTLSFATSLGFFSRMCGLESLEMLESKHHLVTSLSVESFSGVLQMI